MHPPVHKTLVRFLIVRANGDCRVVSRPPTLAPDEMAVRLHIQVPGAWGRVQNPPIEVVLPEVPRIEVSDAPH